MMHKYHETYFYTLVCFEIKSVNVYTLSNHLTANRHILGRIWQLAHVHLLSPLPKQESFAEVVHHFAENSKTSQPNSVFPVLLRFVNGFRVGVMQSKKEKFRLL